MSLSEEIKDNVAVLAGQTSLPLRVAQHCNNPLVIGLAGQTDASLYKDFNYKEISLGQIGKLFKTLKKNNIKHITMVGRLRRPTMSEIKLDAEGALMAAKFGVAAALGSSGDDGLLRKVKTIMEKEGYQVIGPHLIMHDLLLDKGIMGKHKLSERDLSDIERGRDVAEALGIVDVGQAVIVQNGLVLGVEAIEGTDALIRRCKNLKRGEKGGVLVKCMKPTQDPNLDVPTIGLGTLKELHAAGFSGVAAIEGKTLVASKDEMVEFADKKGLFIYGMKA